MATNYVWLSTCCFGNIFVDYTKLSHFVADVSYKNPEF